MSLALGCVADASPGASNLATALVERGAHRLIVAGERSGAVVDHLGLKTFRISPEIAAGVPVPRTKPRAADCPRRTSLTNGRSDVPPIGVETPSAPPRSDDI